MSMYLEVGYTADGFVRIIMRSPDGDEMRCDLLRADAEAHRRDVDTAIECARQAIAEAADGGDPEAASVAPGDRVAELEKETERLRTRWLCDCHTWPGPDEAHEYIVALEKRLNGVRWALVFYREGGQGLSDTLGDIEELSRAALARVSHTAEGAAETGIAPGADQQETT